MINAEHIAQTDWLAHELADDGRLNLLCFPYAGGTSSIFNRWRTVLPDWINVCPLVFPGRESRRQQPHDGNFTTLAGKIAEVLLPQLRNVNFALYGHSMGAWFAHDLALRACQQAAPPRCLLVSGQLSPQLAYPYDTQCEMDDSTLLRFVSSFGKLNTNLLAKSRLIDSMLELTRADLSLCETHTPVPFDLTLSCPLHLFANDSDPVVTLDLQRPWRFRTTGKFSLSWHRGDHFFIRTHTAEFLEKLIAVLEQTPAARII